MPTYSTNDGEPHAIATAETKKQAAEEAFTELLAHNNRNDIEFLTVGKSVTNPANPEYDILHIEYRVGSSDKPDVIDVEPQNRTVWGDATPIHPDGTPATVEDWPDENDCRWEVSIVDEIRHIPHDD